MSEQSISTRDKPMEFIPFGNQDKIKLTIDIVRNLLCKPTRSGKLCSDRDAMKFMMLCSARKLNPFEGDAFLVGYDTQGVAEFNLITAEQAFLKRADLSPEYDGIESGVTVKNEDGTIVDIQGEFVSETQILLAGWARLPVKNRSIPFFDRLDVKNYMKPGPFWEKNPAHQIAKCARAAVLRRAFSTSLGGLYLQVERDERPLKNVGDAYDLPASRFVEVQSTPAQPNGNRGEDDSNAELNPVTTPAARTGKVSPGAELIQYLMDNGHSFDDFVRWALATDQLKNADSIGNGDEIPAADAKRLLRIKETILKGIVSAKQQPRELIP